MGSVIVAGDLNGQLLAEDINGNNKSRMLTHFIRRMNFLSVQEQFHEGNAYTYVPNKTVLDYILIEPTFQSKVRSFSIIDSNEILVTSINIGPSPIDNEF